MLGVWFRGVEREAEDRMVVLRPEKRFNTCFDKPCSHDRWVKFQSQSTKTAFYDAVGIMEVRLCWHDWTREEGKPTIEMKMGLDGLF